MARTPTASATATAPIQNGAWTLTFSPSLPATYGAIAPPEKRTKEYAADATGRSTGAAPITASVIRVLLMPRNAPATMMPTTRAPLESVARAITRGRREQHQRGSTTGTVPKRRCSRGATNTDVTASSIPQPKKIKPTCEAVMSSGNGANASSVKKPKL